MSGYRHIVPFRLYLDVDAGEVLALSVRWPMSRGSCGGGSPAALEAFRVAPAHVAIADYLSENADWVVADHQERRTEG